MKLRYPRPNIRIASRSRQQVVNGDLSYFAAVSLLGTERAVKGGRPKGSFNPDCLGSPDGGHEHEARSAFDGTRGGLPRYTVSICWIIWRKNGWDQRSNDDLSLTKRSLADQG